MTRQPDVPAAALRALLRDVFGTSSDVSFERTAEGAACPVYRLRHGDSVFYLRFAEEPGQDLHADAEVHDHLRAIGILVPEVVHIEAHDDRVDRSYLVMREVPGIPLSDERDPSAARRVAREAAEDVARMNDVEVAGFGWLQRTGKTWPPRAELGQYADFVTSHLPVDAAARAMLVGDLLTEEHLDTIEVLLAAERARSLPAARLAHGDLDVSAIYCLDGRYTGIIDFSELRGAEPTFDLAHFLLHDGETNPLLLWDDFSAGYASAVSGADKMMVQARRSAVLLGFRQLCRWLGPERSLPPTTFLAGFRAAQLANLLDGRPAAAPR